MVSIYISGEDRTQQINNWSIYWNDKRQSLMLKCHFHTKKSFTCPLDECRIVPTLTLSTTLLIKKGNTSGQTIETATIYGERYAVVHYPGTPHPYIYKTKNIEFIEQTALKETSIFRYFTSVATAREDRAISEKQKEISANIGRQLEKLPPRADTALHAYCTGINSKQEPGPSLIYPFGINESQLTAVEQAFSAQVSLIEGPPGTGKTQTILNILANILLRGKTAAVLSNNNAAVANIYEKLEKSKLDHVVARLGSKANREIFFANLPALPAGEPESAPTMDAIQKTLEQLKQHLRNHNVAAQLKADIDELTIERRHLQEWHKENKSQPLASLEKYRLPPRKATDLMAYLAYLKGQPLRLRNRLDLLLHFKILRTKPFAAADARLSFSQALQMHYYDQTLQEKQAALSVCNQSLASGNFTALLDALTTGSMQLLKQHLHQPAHDAQVFDSNTYQKNFDAFLKRFPILGSGTHSIVNSMQEGAVLDYVIIDEASQQDIIPGILALGCAKNLIIVGDNRQLAHIPAVLGLKAPADHYDCERYSLLDSCMGVFKEALPRTLLKEHYRCHPKIIQFCNQQFYGNALVPMTQDNSESPLRMLVTAKGNHTRQNTNMRELDSLLKVLEDKDESAWVSGDGRGFITPFRAQATLSDAYLPEDFVKDTVHKFQGRECNEIVFSTVLDKKRSSQGKLQFVDDARMINVAVSRAKHRFTLITGDDVFTTPNSHIAALTRYIEYYAEDREVLRAPVVSAFDLLYQEYDQSLEQLHSRLQSQDSPFKSEQIVAQLLRQALSDASCRALVFHTQVLLNQIASPSNPALTQQEQLFMQHHASCDFVLYFKVGKTPVGVIEVDGSTHNEPTQMARDALKNKILEKSGIPILRLRIVESQIEEKIASFLTQWSGTAPLHAATDNARHAPSPSAY